MSSRIRVLLALLAVTLSGTEVAAIELPAHVTLGIEIPTLPAVLAKGAGPLQVGTRAGSADHLASFSLPANLVNHVATVPVTDPFVFPIHGLMVSVSNAGGLFAENAGQRLGGVMSLHGVTKVCLFSNCSASVANVVVPLDVIGQGGGVAVSAVVNVTVRGAPWTTAPIQSFGAASPYGTRQGPLHAGSSTAQSGGQLSIVTPIYISTNIGSLPTIDALGRVRVDLGAPPSCDVAVDRGSYGDGDTLRITRLHFSNPGPQHAFRVQLAFEIAGFGSFTLIDRVATLPAGFDRELAPISGFTVAPEQPRGTYRLHCGLSEADGEGLAHAVAEFQVR